MHGIMHWRAGVVLPINMRCGQYPGTARMRPTCCAVQELHRLRERNRACQYIQAEWRLYKLRQGVRQRLQEARAARAAKYAALQRHLQLTWETLRTQHRIVIHLPSLPGSSSPARLASLRSGAASATHCASDCSATQLEAAQLPRICDVADSRVDVLFVAPSPLSDEVRGYWRQLLHQGGVARPESRCAPLATPALVPARR
jgi:hypothetical protein